MANDGDDWLAVLYVPRGNAAARGVLWGILGCGLLLLVLAVFRGLQFKPSGASNRLVDYSIAVLLLPVAAGALFSMAAAIRLILLACWASPIGAFAARDALTVRLGPFGSSHLDAGRLEIRYPFEEPDGAVEEGFEAMLPEEMQIAQLCPRMSHPQLAQRLDLLLARRTGYTSEEIANILRPAIEFYRQASSAQGES